MKRGHIEDCFVFRRSFAKLGLQRGPFLASATLSAIAFSWGCAGVVGGPNQTTPPPPPPTYSVSGTISPSAGGNGATVTLSGAASATTTADSSGSYMFTGLANGAYAVTPSKVGYTFSPTSNNATVNGANVTGINFTATAQTTTYSISGTITIASPAGTLSGATITLSGPAAATTTTDSSGNYSFSGLANGTYTATPTDSGYTFTPLNQAVTVNGGNQTGVNFTATPHLVALTWVASTTTTVTSYNVYRSTTSGSGYVKIGSTVNTVLTYIDSPVPSGIYYYVTTAVDGSGAESVNSNEVSAHVP